MDGKWSNDSVEPILSSKTERCNKNSDALKLKLSFHKPIKKTNTFISYTVSEKLFSESISMKRYI